MSSFNFDTYDRGIKNLPGNPTQYGLSDEELKRQEEEVKRNAERKQQEEAAKAAQEAANAKPPPSPIQEAGTAIIGGVGDFIEDTVEKWTPLELPDSWSPVNETEWGKGLRRFAGVVIPQVALSLFARGRINKAIGAEKLAAMPSVQKYIGSVGLEAGISSLIGAAATQYEENTTIATDIKDALPESWQWVIPDVLTVMDTDSPDVRRVKNIAEDVGFGIGWDMLGWAVRGARALVGGRMGTKIIPKDADAKAFQAGFDDAAKGADDLDLEDTLNKAEDAREDVRFERAKKDIEADPEGKVPTPDVNTPLHEQYEQVVTTRSADAARQSDIASARIKEDIDTVDGRLPPLKDSAEVRDSLINDPTGMQARKELAEQWKLAGKYDVETMNGRRITYDKILDKEDDLRSAFRNLDEETLKGFMEAIKRGSNPWLGGSVGRGKMDPVTTGRAIQGFKVIKEVLDPQNVIASGRLARTIAGQVSDQSTAIRQMYDRGLDTTRQQELQLELMEFLEKEIQFTSYADARALQLYNVWKGKEIPEDVLKQLDEEANAKLAEISKRSKEFAQTARKLMNENPLAYRALIGAYESSDGDVRTIEAVHRWAQQSLDPRQLLFRMPGEAESQFAKGVQGVVYNSWLSSTATPLRAGFSNMTNSMLKDISYAVGAKFFSGGNKYQMKRAAISISTELEAMADGWHHMWKVWKKMAKDPTAVKYAAREEIVEASKVQMEALESYAEMEMQKGNYAPMLRFRITNAMHNFNNWVYSRYSVNAMTSMDAFVRSYWSTKEARFRAMDRLLQKNPDRLDFDPKEIDAMRKEIRAEMFDKQGYLKDEAVEQMSRELTMNLDTPLSQHVNGILNTVPALRTLIAFPRTSLNAFNFAMKSNHLTAWMTDVKQILDANKNYDIDMAREIMKKRGRTFNKTEWDALVIETKGRLAVGDMFVMAAMSATMMGMMTGNGPKTEKERRAWQQIGGWQPRSLKFGDVQISYAGVEPFATIMSMVSDMTMHAMDGNSAILDEWFDKVSMTISSSIGNQVLLTGIQPLIEAMHGNDRAMQQWVAQTANAFAPWAGARNQLGQLLYPGLRELEGDFGSFVRNRNGFLDVTGMGNLPFAHNITDGKVARDQNLIQRALNYGTPFRISQQSGPHWRWALGTGWNAELQMRTSETTGLKYTAKERSTLAKLIGEQGIFDKAIRDLQKNESLERNDNFYRRQRLNGVTKADMKDERPSHRLIKQAFTEAKQIAEATMYAMPEFQPIVQKGFRAKQLEAAQKSGNTQAIQELLSIPK